MLSGLDTLRFHLKQVMEREGMSGEALEEVDRAVEEVQDEFDRIGRRLRALEARLNETESYHN